MPAFPLHSLIFSNDFIPFAAHECLDVPNVAWRLVGSEPRPELASIVFTELRHLVTVKLSLGERAVVAPNALTQAQQSQLEHVARGQGAQVVRLDDRPFNSIPHQNNPTGYAGWDGITIVGDVHGDATALQQTLDWAASRQHFIWFLGDVLDYGPQSLECIALVYEAVMHQRAGMILANHERKISRWLNQDGGRYPTRLSAGNRVTTAAYERLAPQARGAWAGQFRALFARSRLIQQIDSYVMAHAAVHPSFWTRPDPLAIERYALFGEGEPRDGGYRRTHRWIDHVPAGKTVFVGHTMLAEWPMLMTGQHGGQVVFLDTGSGKGGCLSSADLRFTANGLRLECFRKY